MEPAVTTNVDYQKALDRIKSLEDTIRLGLRYIESHQVYDKYLRDTFEHVLEGLPLPDPTVRELKDMIILLLDGTSWHSIDGHCSICDRARDMVGRDHWKAV